jgi:serine phosphatase RsbU (regulator of sigma subunit)
VEESVDYQEETLELAPRDLVFGYTDGLIEARRAGEVFGVNRLSAFVGEHAAGLSPQELVRGVHEEVTAWADGLSDDAVALALRRSA